MNDLIAKVAQELRLDPETARTAVTSVVSLLERQRHQPRVYALLSVLPGIETAHSPRRLWSRISNAIATDREAANASLLTHSGIGADKVRPLVGAFVAWAKNHANDDIVDDAIDSVPVLNMLA